MSRRYKPLKKAYVKITKDFKTVFNGMRTLYTKDMTGRVYIRYKNRYYPAYYDGPYSYYVRLKW